MCKAVEEPAGREPSMFPKCFQKRNPAAAAAHLQVGFIEVHHAPPLRLGVCVRPLQLRQRQLQQTQPAGWARSVARRVNMPGTCLVCAVHPHAGQAPERGLTCSAACPPSAAAAGVLPRRPAAPRTPPAAPTCCYARLAAAGAGRAQWSWGRSFFCLFLQAAHMSAGACFQQRLPLTVEAHEEHACNPGPGAAKRWKDGAPRKHRALLPSHAGQRCPSGETE